MPRTEQGYRRPALENDSTRVVPRVSCVLSYIDIVLPVTRQAPMFNGVVGPIEQSMPTPSPFDVFFSW